MENKKIFIEKIKNVSIVVLFITAILLLSFFWKYVSLDMFSNLDFSSIMDEEKFQPEAADIILPSKIEVGFGNDINTVVNYNYALDEKNVIYRPEINTYTKDGKSDKRGGKSESESRAGSYKDNAASSNGTMDTKVYSHNVYSSMLAAMEIYLQQKDLLVEEIKKEQYDEVMMYRSIAARFDYSIPFSEFIGINSLTAADGIERIPSMSKIAFSVASSENVFVYDNISEKYYRMATGNEEVSNMMTDAMLGIIEQIETDGYTTYYSIENLAGLKNQELIPLYMESEMENVPVAEAFSIEKSGSVAKAERMFFPDGLDFVRKITENKGSLLYVYGYSEKVLVLDESGSISYDEEFDPAMFNEESFRESLDEALIYVTGHGGWKNLYAGGFSPYLAGFNRIYMKDKQYSGYEFVIGQHYNGIPVQYDKGAVMKIAVYGKQIVSFYRDAVIKRSDQEHVPDGKWVAKDAIDVITDQYVSICRILEKHALETGDEESAQKYGGMFNFEELMRRMKDIRMVYLRSGADGGTQLVPMWSFSVDGCIFWCNPADGRIMKYYVEEAE